MGGIEPVVAGLAVGALTYFIASARVDSAGGDNPGRALALGAFLDGIPEQLVLGITLATGAEVSLGLLAAIFVSNLPEAVGGASEMDTRGGADV